MTVAEDRRTNRESAKDKIRKRYKGVDPDSLELIPAKEKKDIYEDTQEIRVAVYARVSTDDPRQTSSYELQKTYYENLIIHHEHWHLVEIYADEGISGTSLNHRDAFVKMINDCKDGKIDLIITKSVSRFARNILDCIGYARELAALQPPIGIMFETERIYTLDSSSEMTLSFMATLAQEESHNKSDIMNASIEMRFKHGIFLTPVLLGYDKDEEGNLIVNDEESVTVRLIFYMFLSGYKINEIIEYLEKYDRVTKRGNTKWSYASVLQILQNERYCGDILARKTFTPNYLNHKSKKNNNDRNQYYKRDHHERIITRDDYLAVQEILHNAKQSEHPGFLPEPEVIKSGYFAGYVIINPRWAGFNASDYLHASESVCDNSTNTHGDSNIIKASKGDFDMRGFEIVRGQFFPTPDKLSISFKPDTIRFSRTAINKLNQSQYIEILVHPLKKTIVVRPSSRNNRHSMKWFAELSSKHNPITINAKAFMPSLYELFGWSKGGNFRICGCYIEKENERFELFDLADAEMAITKKQAHQERKKTIYAYPQEWIDTFGIQYYQRAAEKEQHKEIQNGDIFAESIKVNCSGLQVTDENTVKDHINSLLKQMEAASNGTGKDENTARDQQEYTIS